MIISVALAVFDAVAGYLRNFSSWKVSCSWCWCCCDLVTAPSEIEFSRRHRCLNRRFESIKTFDYFAPSWVSLFCFSFTNWSSIETQMSCSRSWVARMVVGSCLECCDSAQISCPCLDLWTSGCYSFLIFNASVSAKCTMSLSALWQYESRSGFASDPYSQTSMSCWVGWHSSHLEVCRRRFHASPCSCCLFTQSRCFMNDPGPFWRTSAHFVNC